MKRLSILAIILCLSMSFTCMAQTRKTGTVQRKTGTVQKKSSPQKKPTVQSANNDGAEFSIKGHIDLLNFEESPMTIDKKIKANYSFKVFRETADDFPYGSNMIRPERCTIILSCDIDWIALGEKESVPFNLSWSGPDVKFVTVKNNGNTMYTVMDGDYSPACIVKTKNGNQPIDAVIITGGSKSLTADLYQGMQINDIKTKFQKEVPEVRIVSTGKKKNGLNENVMYGNSNERWWVFWTDANGKVVKWFDLTSET